MPMTPQAEAAHAAWKAARDHAAACRAAEPHRAADEDLNAFFEQRTTAQRKTWDAERAASAAFRAMSSALPDPGPRVFISPTDWLAKQAAWRTEYAAVKVWNSADHYRDWYTCIGMFEIDTTTGERFFRAAEMFDDAVDEAVRRNAQLVDYYARRAA